MSQQQVTFGDEAPRAEEKNRPNWHAFGMLAAWLFAGAVVLLFYILEVANSLDAFKVALTVTWLLWLAVLVELTLATFQGSNLRNPHHQICLVVGWGLASPLTLWGTGAELQLNRGFPVVEAILITCVNIYLGGLPFSGVIGQHALFLCVTCMDLWARAPPSGIMETATHLVVTATNFFLGISGCCLLSLAHNRQSSLSLFASAAAAGPPAKGHVKKTATADAPALPKSLSLRASLFAWVQLAEFLLLEAVPQEDAKQITDTLSAMFVGIRFLTCAANYAAPGLVAMSPTMDVLAIVLGMMMGGSPDMQGWTDAQLRAYRSVRGLLQSIMPAHVADALEAYETERHQAFPTPSTASSSWESFSRSRRASCSAVVGQPPSSRASYTGLVGSSQGQPPSSSRRASYTGLVGSSQGQPSSCSRMASCASSLEPSQEQPPSRSKRASFTALVGLTKLQPGPIQPSKGLARTQSGDASQSYLPSLPSTHTRSTLHHTVSSPCISETTTPLDSEYKMTSTRRPPKRRLTALSERHEQVTVLFADIVGFTTLSDQLTPSEVMRLLCDLYKEYDERAVELGLYTCDTIGDCYMCAANLIQPLPNHVDVMVGFAQDIIAIANATISPLGTTLSIRAGIHTGPLMSGVIGVHRLKFSLLGQTVVVAAAMEKMALTDTVQISERAYKHLRRERLAMLPEAEDEQSFADMHGLEDKCSVARNNSAPDLLAHLQDEGEAPLTPIRSSKSTGTVNQDHNLKALNSLADQQELQGQGHHCQEVEEKQQQFFCEQPGGLDRGPSCPSCWLERKVDVKGKGFMKAYTYIGQ